MKTKYLFYTIMLLGLFTACTKFPSGSSDCPPVKDVYFRFKDTFATSLVDVYKQGDTLKLKHNSGTIYYFVAQKPDSGYTFKKPVTYGTCDEDNYYMQYYQIELKPTVQTQSSIFVKVFYKFGGNIASTQDQFRIDFNFGYYEAPIGFLPPPSAFYYKDYKINSILYLNVSKITYAYTSPPVNYILFNREQGLIKLTQPNGELYELEP
ncbi:MAG: hypothetical protein NTU43_07510 [Bacteroidetes bacterium]|nr:hypothetical protein [Bacteroidota bacterium]